MDDKNTKSIPYLAARLQMCRSADKTVNEDTVAEQLQVQYAAQFPQHEEALEQITIVFGTFGISDKVGLAQTIYISSSLPEKNTNDNFYTSYANCFLAVTEEKPLTDCITEVFGIEFTDKDKADIAAWSG